MIINMGGDFMNVGKKRPFSHIKGDKGVEILRKCLPEEWVVREYKPDYGIDLSIELFAQYKDGFITRGEHIFFQVKGTASIEKCALKIKERYNVEKGYRPNGKEETEINAVKFVIDTDLLATVETMGSSVPVMLAVVDINTEDVFFLCLNDYLEKVIIPENPDYTRQTTKTIYIPAKNLINDDGGIEAIEWYAKRSKLYALFNKINYQARELEYCDHCEIEARIQHYIKILWRSDAWSAEKYFGAMLLVKGEIEYYMEHGITQDAEQIINKMLKDGEDVDESIYEATYCNGLVSFREASRVQGLHQLWQKLTMMGDVFEDVTKEAFLPTSLGIDISELQ